jgi:anhydro-N-acetylmuramic acid kinase
MSGHGAALLAWDNLVSKLTTALGLMSGTSLDGIDVALIRTDGENIVERGPSQTYSYTDEQRNVLRSALQDAKGLERREDRPLGLAKAEAALTDWHVQAVQDFLKTNPATIDIVGYHGQTVIHRPEIKLTVQLGDGLALAKRLGVAVVFDLRAADVAAGGQGAPLVPVYHRALATTLPMRPIAFLNIGGVANVTWIGPQGEMIAFDTGPGNALLNDWAMRHLGIPQDTDGALALKGKVNDRTVDAALTLPYFDQPPPKSLDRNAFDSVSLDGLSPEDGAATLVAFTKFSIMLANDWFPSGPKRYIVCGGGRRNPAIMSSLPGGRHLFQTAEEAGFNGDSMEAEAWAYLAVRSQKNLPISFPMTTGVSKPMTGGVLALP